MGGKRKRCRKERVGPVAANSDNLESNKEAEGRAQGTLGSSKNCTSRESVSPLSRLIRGFRNKYLFFGKWTTVGIPTPFSDKVGGGKMQTSSPPVITPNRSQSNPHDMITLPRPIQSVDMDLHDVSGTSTGQTLPRERRAPPGTHFCPTIWWVYPHFATIFILHPLLSTFPSTFVRYWPWRCKPGGEYTPA